MALSIDFSGSVSFPTAIQATGFDFFPGGPFSPTEHSCLSWTCTLPVGRSMPPPRSSGDLDQERKSVKKIEEMFDEQGKIEGLIVNLIGDSKLVLIHSSVSSMGFVQSGAESVVEALKSLSKEGLLL